MLVAEQIVMRTRWAGINRILIPLGLQSCSKHIFFHYYSFRTVANSYSGSICSTELSEVLNCVSWLLTMVSEFLVGLYKITAGLKNGEKIP